MKRKIIYSGVLALGFLAILCCIAIGYSDNLITKTAEGKTFQDTVNLPHTQTGLLLGTSKFTSNGNINLYFKYRIIAAAKLLKSGKIDFLIISGDNSRKGYDEPTDMRAELIKMGIDSTKIFLDYAGFRTYDSMVRLKEIFGQTEVIIISQKFHNERAIYMAEKLKIKAVGYNAQDVKKYYGFKTALREKFARVKVVLDFMLGKKPKFLGEKIELK